jgi:hypothetical protein
VQPLLPRHAPVAVLPRLQGSPPMLGTFHDVAGPTPWPCLTSTVILSTYGHSRLDLTKEPEALGVLMSGRGARRRVGEPVMLLVRRANVTTLWDMV